jgi:hypothetical protein
MTSAFIIVAARLSWFSSYIYSGVLFAGYGLSVLVGLMALSRCAFQNDLQAIFLIKTISQRLYEQKRLQQFAENRHSLSERYQLSENVRSAKMLNPLIAFLAASSVLTTIFYNVNMRLFPLHIQPIAYEFYYVLRVLQVCNFSSSSFTETIHFLFCFGTNSLY